MKLVYVLDKLMLCVASYIRFQKIQEEKLESEMVEAAIKRSIEDQMELKGNRL